MESIIRFGYCLRQHSFSHVYRSGIPCRTGQSLLDFPLQRSTRTLKYKHNKGHTMAKKKSSTPPEETLLLPVHPARADTPLTEHISTVDTHTHLLSTFSTYRSTYKSGKFETIWEFVRAMYHGRSVEAIVDVWCEAPVMKTQWKEIADSALTEEQVERDWNGIQYWFVMGTYPSCQNQFVLLHTTDWIS